jgi:hypothetical protein
VGERGVELTTWPRGAVVDHFDRGRVGMRYLLSSAIAALAMAVTPASALAETENITFPLEAGAFVPCALGGTGEEITTSGTAHLVIQSVAPHQGVTYRVLHDNYQGLRGVGATSRDTYHAVAAETEIVPTSEFNVVTFAQMIQFIGQGPGNNFQIHFIFHVTVNANGEVTASLYELKITCR